MKNCIHLTVHDLCRAAADYVTKTQQLDGTAQYVSKAHVFHDSKSIQATVTIESTVPETKEPPMPNVPTEPGFYPVKPKNDNGDYETIACFSGQPPCMDIITMDIGEHETGVIRYPADWIFGPKIDMRVEAEGPAQEEHEERRDLPEYVTDALFWLQGASQEQHVKNAIHALTAYHSPQPKAAPKPDPDSAEVEAEPDDRPPLEGFVAATFALADGDAFLPMNVFENLLRLIAGRVDRLESRHRRWPVDAEGKPHWPEDS